MTASPLHPDATAVPAEEVREGDQLALADPRTVTAVRTETGDGGEPAVYLDLDGTDPAGPIPPGALVHVIRA